MSTGSSSPLVDPAATRALSAPEHVAPVANSRLRLMVASVGMASSGACDSIVTRRLVRVDVTVGAVGMACDGMQGR
jgi:hypothetical protein